MLYLLETRTLGKTCGLSAFPRLVVEFRIPSMSSMSVQSLDMSSFSKQYDFSESSLGFFTLFRPFFFLGFGDFSSCVD